MNKYELVIILDSQMANEERDNVVKQATDMISKLEGKIINSQLWLDKFKMFFDIRRCSYGTYYLINFESVSTALKKIKDNLRLNEQILRFVIFRND